MPSSSAPEKWTHTYPSPVRPRRLGAAWERERRKGRARRRDFMMNSKILKRKRADDS
jgi:hypothetical protein